MSILNNREVIVYSKSDCPWCDKAKALLTEKNIPFKELKYNIDFSREQIAEKIPFNYNRVTLPQVFVDTIHIGGYENLKEFLRQMDLVSDISEWKKSQDRTHDER